MTKTTVTIKNFVKNVDQSKYRYYVIASEGVLVKATRTGKGKGTKVKTKRTIPGGWQKRTFYTINGAGTLSGYSTM
jgi:hypothetical protein